MKDGVRGPRAATRSCFAFALVMVLVVGAAACVPRWPQQHHRSGHTSWYETFVDTTRPTVPSVGPTLPSRTLATAIYRPNRHGQFPLIVFAHGASGHPVKFTKLFSAWADAGYVVAAPAFPLTNDHAASQNLGDLAQQPGDMSFVLDHVLAIEQKRAACFPPSTSTGSAPPVSHSAASRRTCWCTGTAAVTTASRPPRSWTARRADGRRTSRCTSVTPTDPTFRTRARSTYDRARPPVWFVAPRRLPHVAVGGHRDAL
jgi:hypothetical protein